VSIVIPAYHAQEHLLRCLDSVLGQDLEEPFEVIVVVSADEDEDLSYLETMPDDDRLRIMVRRPRLPCSTARHLGIQEAQATVLVATDADVVAAPGWLRAIVQACRSSDACVGGAVANGTPDSVAGTTEYILEFLDLHPRRPPNIWHAVTANLAFSRGAYERFGPFADVTETAEVGGEDTAFTLKAAAAGQLSFCADAVVTHHNRTAMHAVLRHQRHLGRTFASLAHVCPNLPLRHAAKRGWTAPIVGVARCYSVARRLATWRIGLGTRALRVAGPVTIALGVWTWGVVEGNRLVRTMKRAPTAVTTHTLDASERSSP
jgi:glycosyltransferase involved in cell wall biosynthesis